MVSTETQAEIRRLFYVEHMKVYAISQYLHVSRDAVRRVLNVRSFSYVRVGTTRSGKVIPYASSSEDMGIIMRYLKESEFSSDDLLDSFALFSFAWNKTLG